MPRRTLPRLLPVLLLVTGCRTYGGHGSEAATAAAIGRTVEWGQQERSRLSNDEMAFNEVASRLPVLEDFAPRLQALSASLTGTITKWRARAETVDASSPYRDLNRVFGSILAERQRYEDRYRRFVLDLSAALGEGSAGPRGAARYQVAPVWYAQVSSRLDDRRIGDLLSTLQ